MEELKACPFCEEIEATGPVHNSPHPEWWVQCSECSANGPIKETKAESIEAWNQRAEPEGFSETDMW